MIVLDTNVISELMRAEPDRVVLKWLDLQPSMSVWTTVITVLECRFGIEKLAQGQRRDELAGAFTNIILEDLGGRVLVFDNRDADATAKLMADQRKDGRSNDLRDSMIAGMIKVRRAKLATRNVRHFEGADIDVVDPWSM